MPNPEGEKNHHWSHSFIHRLKERGGETTPTLNPHFRWGLNPLRKKKHLSKEIGGYASPCAQRSLGVIGERDSCAYFGRREKPKGVLSGA